MTATATTTVIAQHLTGNSPDGFDDSRFLDLLRADYILTVQGYQAGGFIPAGEIDVQIDVHDASGYCDSATVYVCNDDDNEPLCNRELERDISEAKNRVWDACCANREFYLDADCEPLR